VIGTVAALVLGSLAASGLRLGGLEPEAVAVGLEHGGVVHDAVDDGCRRGGIEAEL
jgi:hypothetical protein